MRIIETCPKCGADIEDLVVATLPAVPVKRCTKCDWRWEGKRGREDVIRIPFTVPDVVDPWKYGIAPNAGYYVPNCCRNCSNHPSNGGSGICHCMLPYMTYTGTGGSDWTVSTSSTEYMFGGDGGDG